MNRNRLEELAQSGESETLEFKRSTGQRREAAQTLCAMLNHRGGCVLFGVEPGGRVVGQDVTDKSVEDVAHEIQEIQPPAFPTIDRVSAGKDRQVIAVTVTQGQGRPYTYKGKTYKRVGNTSQEMSREEYNRMLFERLHGEMRWENQPAEGWSVTDLDLTVDALFEPHESLPWNPLIARVFFRRGIIESWGRGTLKMVELTQQAGLPHPEIEETAGCVSVRFRPSRYVAPERIGHTLTKRQQRILSLLGRGGDLPLRELRSRLGAAAPDWAIKEDLALLKGLSLVDTAGYGRGAYWYLKGRQ